MSNLMPSRTATKCPAADATKPVLEAYPTRSSELGGGLTVRRALPHRQRRLVGPWCFLDHFGPIDFHTHKGIDVAPHPHIGLQTVTWLIEGEVLHKDSLGYEQLIRPGQLNLMTAGRGIAHSEETPAVHSASLHGAQLWIALPHAQRQIEPAFEHHPELPVAGLGPCRATVLAGELAGMRSPARVYSPIVGAEIAAAGAGSAEIPLNPRFEHAILVITGEMEIEGHFMEPGTLFYLGSGRDRLSAQFRAQSRLMLVGGMPFGEDIIIWWNFVARTADEIAAARADWEQQRRFGEVTAYQGQRLSAPRFELRPKLKPS
jgi:redox-sensitive bicupin YhaK (pirin superfamily)